MEIWKQEIEIGTSSYSLPEGARILTVDEQFGKVCIWFECEPSSPIVERTIKAHLTGQPITGNNIEYLGTALLLSGSFVVHVYEYLGE